MSSGSTRGCQESGCDRPAALGDARCPLHVARFGSIPLGDGPETPRPTVALATPAEAHPRRPAAPYLASAAGLMVAAPAAGLVPLLGPSYPRDATPLLVFLAFNAAPVLLAGGIVSAIVSVRRSTGLLAHSASWLLLLYSALWVVLAGSLYFTTGHTP